MARGIVPPPLPGEHRHRSFWKSLPRRTRHSVIVALLISPVLACGLAVDYFRKEFEYDELQAQKARQHETLMKLADLAIAKQKADAAAAREVSKPAPVIIREPAPRAPRRLQPAIVPQPWPRAFQAPPPPPPWKLDLGDGFVITSSAIEALDKVPSRAGTIDHFRSYPPVTNPYVPGTERRTTFQSRYDDDSIRASLRFTADGDLDGEGVFYHHTGEPLFRVTFASQKLAGAITMWDEAGELLCIISYSGHSKDGLAITFRAGMPVLLQGWKNGKLIVERLAKPDANGDLALHFVDVELDTADAERLRLAQYEKQITSEIAEGRQDFAGWFRKQLDDSRSEIAKALSGAKRRAMIDRENARRADTGAKINVRGQQALRAQGH